MMCMCLSHNAHLITVIMAMITVIINITTITTTTEIAIRTNKPVDSRKREIISNTISYKIPYH